MDGDNSALKKHVVGFDVKSSIPTLCSVLFYIIRIDNRFYDIWICLGSVRSVENAIPKIIGTALIQ